MTTKNPFHVKLLTCKDNKHDYEKIENYEKILFFYTSKMEVMVCKKCGWTIP